MKETFTLVATAAAGLEAVVGRELRELGYETQVENGKKKKKKKQPYNENYTISIKS